MNAAGHDEGGRRHERSTSGGSKRGRRAGEVRKLAGQRAGDKDDCLCSLSQAAYHGVGGVKWWLSSLQQVSLVDSQALPRGARNRPPAANKL